MVACTNTLRRNHACTEATTQNSQVFFSTRPRKNFITIKCIKCVETQMQLPNCITIIPINVYDQANVALIMIGELFGSEVSNVYSHLLSRKCSGNSKF